jgi:FtsP/CotA-like multicopper oxidase with cupredoxin domain
MRSSELTSIVGPGYPGPTIEVNSDDRIVVNVTNLMPNATAVRIHALGDSICTVVVRRTALVQSVPMDLAEMRRVSRAT